MFCPNFSDTRSYFSGAFKDAAASFQRGMACDFRSAAFLAAAVLCAILPLELSHLASALLGAIGYLVVQRLQSRMEWQKVEKTPKPLRAPISRPRTPVQVHPPVSVTRAAPAPAEQQGRGGTGTPLAARNRFRTDRTCGAALRPPPGLAAPAQPEDQSSHGGSAAPAALGATFAPQREVRRPSAMPVAAPTFAGVGWEAEVSELLGRIAPTAESDQVVAQIALDVKKAIRCIVPEAEVTGFASGSLISGTAFGVAVPEVDIVISASPTALVGRLQGRWSQTPGTLSAKVPRHLDARKLHKSAIRACTDKLVGTGAFKFRRSAFRGQEPKVTIIAPSPSSLASSGQGVPVNLSVNSVTPFYNAALLTECGQFDPRAKELVLLVKRWAKDRGLCHAAKGHLSPYTWTLLTIFFLQAGAEKPLLPALASFTASSELLPQQRKAATSVSKSLKNSSCTPTPTPSRDGSDKKVGELFKEFVDFYTQDFDWQREAVSVRLGKRAPPDVSLPLHIALHSDGATSAVGPSIEDPFELSSNLGACTTVASLERLREEFRRAHQLVQSGASLTTLLEPWAPPEAGPGTTGMADEDDD